MLTVGQEGSPLIEINGGSDIWTMKFTANGEYIVGSGEGLQVWRAENGKPVATMAARESGCHMSRRVQGWQMDRSGDI